MTWDIVIERKSVPLPGWLCTQEQAAEMGETGLMELAMEDWLAVFEEFGGPESIIRFRRNER